jgi:hypothetical protein
VKGPDPAGDDRFGGAVGLSGGMLVVGAPGDASASTGLGGDPFDDSLLGSGAVHVFLRVDGTWIQAAFVKASNPDESDGFGAFLAVSGDTFAVVAVGEASSATGVGGDQASNDLQLAGAVYVFR